MAPKRLVSVLTMVALAQVAACELMVEFDRSKIPVPGFDGSVDGGGTPSIEAGPGPADGASDARADTGAGDGGLDGSLGQDSGDAGSSDGSSDGASDDGSDASSDAATD